MKPCPFCKSEKIRIFENKNTGTFFVECEDCWACGPSKRHNLDAEELWDNCKREGEKVIGNVATTVTINGEEFFIYREFEL